MQTQRRALLTSCVFALWPELAFLSRGEGRDACVNHHLPLVQLPILPGNRLLWYINKVPSRQNSVEGRKPTGLPLKISPLSGLTPPFISQMQTGTESGRKWPRRHHQSRRIRMRKKKQLAHSLCVHSLPRSFIGIHYNSKALALMELMLK